MKKIKISTPYSVDYDSLLKEKEIKRDLPSFEQVPLVCRYAVPYDYFLENSAFVKGENLQKEYFTRCRTLKGALKTRSILSGILDEDKVDPVFGIDIEMMSDAISLESSVKNHSVYMENNVTTTPYDKVIKEIHWDEDEVFTFRWDPRLPLNPFLYHDYPPVKNMAAYGLGYIDSNVTCRNVLREKTAREFYEDLANVRI